MLSNPEFLAEGTAVKVNLMMMMKMMMMIMMMMVMMMLMMLMVMMVMLFIILHRTLNAPTAFSSVERRVMRAGKPFRLLWR